MHSLDSWQIARQKLFRSVPKTGTQVTYLGKKFLVFRNTFWPFEDSVPLVRSLRIKKGDTVLDMGTGSGVVAIYACYKGAGKVVAADINPAAIRSARANARLHGFSKKIRAVRSDLFKAVPRMKFDVITFNPPFRNKKASDLVEKSQWDTSFSVHGRFFEEAGNYLKDGGRIYIAQASFGGTREMLKLAHAHGFLAKLLGKEKKSDGPGVFYAFCLSKRPGRHVRTS